MEAEYRSLASAATDILWFQSLFKELLIPLPSAPILWCDNISAKSLAHNLVFHAKTKHIEIDLHFLRDLSSSGKLDIRYIKVQTVDLFTKFVAITRFQLSASKIVTDRDRFPLKGHVDAKIDDQFSRTKFKLTGQTQLNLRECGSV